MKAQTAVVLTVGCIAICCVRHRRVDENARARTGYEVYITAAIIERRVEWGEGVPGWHRVASVPLRSGLAFGSIHSSPSCQIVITRRSFTLKYAHDLSTGIDVAFVRLHVRRYAYQSSTGAVRTAACTMGWTDRPPILNDAKIDGLNT